MAAVAAIRCNAACKALYDRLVAKGREPKLALVVVMRKLVTLLNALLRDDRRCQTEPPSLPGYYPASPVLQASPPPCRPSLTLTSCWFGVCLTSCRASHVATFFLFPACRRPCHGGTYRFSRRSLTGLRQPASFLGRFGFGPAGSQGRSTSLHVAACQKKEPFRGVREKKLADLRVGPAQHAPLFGVAELARRDQDEIEDHSDGKEAQRKQPKQTRTDLADVEAVQPQES